MKNFFLISCLLCSFILFGQESEKTSQSKDVIERLMKLSSQQLIDTASFYSKKSSFETALICYNLIINTTPKNSDLEQQYKLLIAYDRAATIYGIRSDYRMSYDLFIKALLICEKFNLNDYKSEIYINIGVVYFFLKNFELAKEYYLKALELCNDSVNVVLVLNNLGDTEIRNGNIDNAFNYVNKSFSISKRHKDVHLQAILNTLALYYQKVKLYDSAFYYFKASLEKSKIMNDTRAEAVNLSDLGKMYFELNKIDSAQNYIGISNKIALENNFINILADNYLTLSEIEKSKKNYEKALNYHSIYTNYKDSIYNVSVFGDINQMQRLYEISKTNQQIEELVIDRQIKENTIHYQKIIQRIIFVTLFMMGIILLFVVLQNKKLRKAYNVLVEKNVEIIELYNKMQESVIESGSEIVESGKQNFDYAQLPKEESLKENNYECEKEENYAEDTEIEALEEAQKDLSHTPDFLSQMPVSENNTEKQKKEILSEQGQKELLSTILSFMENTSIICTSDFTMEKLTESIHSNQKYVSFVINNVLKKNFNSFLNGYRIREAQRLFSKSETSKYTVEFVANMVGYKSRNSFSDAFKEITGVTPGFYIMAIHKKK